MKLRTVCYSSVFAQTDQWLQSQKPEDCFSCDVEILEVRPRPELADARCSPGSQALLLSASPSRMLLEADYCPQLPTLSLDKRASQPVTGIVNRSYLNTLKGGYPEPPKPVLSEIRSSIEASDCPLESCDIIYGYIANDC